MYETEVGGDAIRATAKKAVSSKMTAAFIAECGAERKKWDQEEEAEGGEQDVTVQLGVRGEGRSPRSWTHTNISLSQTSTPPPTLSGLLIAICPADGSHSVKWKGCLFLLSPAVSSNGNLRPNGPDKVETETETEAETRARSSESLFLWLFQSRKVVKTMGEAAKSCTSTD